jgi:hypothetical protein
VDRILANQVEFDEESLELSYQSRGREFLLKFGGDFLIDNQIMNTSYSRYDSPYIQAEKKDKTLTFSFRDLSLFLDFENLQRVYSNETYNN